MGDTEGEGDKNSEEKEEARAQARSYPINVKRGTVNKKLALRSSSFSFLLFSFLLLRLREYYAITKLTAMQLSRCTRAFSHTTVFSP